MATINYLVYNTTVAYSGYYRIVRYGVCDSADLAGNAFEVNDVAVINTVAGDIPKYSYDGTNGVYPTYSPTLNAISTVAIPEAALYDPTLDPSYYRTQASPYETAGSENVIPRLDKIYGCFGLGGTSQDSILDFTDVTPPTGFYSFREDNGIGGPDPGGVGFLKVFVISGSVVRASRAGADPRNWMGSRSGSTGPWTWQEESIFGGTEYLWSMTGATAGMWYNTVGASAGTFANTLPTLTNKATSIKRALYSSVATTLNQVLGQRNTEAVLFRGAFNSGLGGFAFSARFTLDTWTNGARFFAGLHTGTGVVTADPSALNNSFGFAVDAADNGLIYAQAKGTGAANRVSTGMTIVSGKAYDVELTAAPGAARVGWKITDLATGAVASGFLTTGLLSGTVGNTFGVLASNAALTAANAVQLGINRIRALTPL